jgi:hypothetical protein
MTEICDIAIGVVGCVAIFGVICGLFSLVKRLVSGVLSSRLSAPDAHHLDFEKGTQ